MKKFAFLFACLFVHFLQPVSAQSKKKMKDSTTVIIFNDPSSSSPKKKKRSGESNIIKIAPLGFVSGTFPVLYEKSITDFFSLQVAAGLTSKNYSRTVFTRDAAMKYDEGTFDPSNDRSEGLYSFDTRKAKLGYMASLQPRVYFESEGLEGGFLGLSFDYYRYNFEVPGLVGSNDGVVKNNSIMQPEHENISDFMVHFGKQTLYDRITMEYSTALGLRNIKGLKYGAGYNSNNTFESGDINYKQTTFNFNIGIKVGYHF